MAAIEMLPTQLVALAENIIMACGHANIFMDSQMSLAKRKINSQSWTNILDYLEYDGLLLNKHISTAFGRDIFQLIVFSPCSSFRVKALDKIKAIFQIRETRVRLIRG